MKRLWLIALAAVLLVSAMAPASLAAPVDHSPKDGLPPDALAHLTNEGRLTWRFFAKYVDPKTSLPLDRVTPATDDRSEQTSPTNIGLYLMSIAAAEDLHYISRTEAVQRVTATLESVNRLEKWQGFLFNWYLTRDGSVKEDWGRFVSTVDNGWFAAGLVVARQAYPAEAGPAATALLGAMDWSNLYNPKLGQMHGGYDVKAGSLTGWTFGLFNTEPRVASYIAIGMGNVPAEHWWRMYRTLPPDWGWQQQTPQGTTATYDNVSVYEGHYSHGDVKFVPTWGGSMFEALMPALVLKEKELGTRGLGLNDQRMVALQMQYAKEQGYPVWGISPSSTPKDYAGSTYEAFGVPWLATAPYKEDAVITPHASFLALEFAPGAAWSNLETLRSRFHALGDYGFYDAVNAKTGSLSESYLALDQGMSLVALDNFLKNGAIRARFNADPVGAGPQRLLSQEVFSIQD